MRRFLSANSNRFTELKSETVQCAQFESVYIETPSVDEDQVLRINRCFFEFPSRQTLYKISRKRTHSVSDLVFHLGPVVCVSNFFFLDRGFLVRPMG